jgi:hypothetical protein
MPDYVPTVYDRVWRWGRFGAGGGLVVFIVAAAAGFVPLAVWHGRGIFFNAGLALGALIAGAFLGMALALAVSTMRPQ